MAIIADLHLKITATGQDFKLTQASIVEMLTQRSHNAAVSFAWYSMTKGVYGTVDFDLETKSLTTRYRTYNGASSSSSSSSRSSSSIADGGISSSTNGDVDDDISNMFGAEQVDSSLNLLLALGDQVSSSQYPNQ